MGKEIAFKNGRISDFRGLVTLTLDRVILHTIMHHSSTSTYTPNFAEIEETFCGRTDIRTDVRTGGRTFETYFIRSTHYIKTEAPLCTTYRHSDRSNFVQRPAGSFFRCVPLPCCGDADSGERERNSQNAKAVGVVKLLLHVPSTGLEHCNHLQQQQQSAVNQHSHVTTCYTYNARP